MFTGIVAEIGTVKRVEHPGGDARLEIDGPEAAQAVSRGASIAVDGVCLTVVERSPGGFSADVMPETLRCTALGELRPGSLVNLEPALAVTGRLDGHIVQGHVDGIGRVLSRQPGPRWDDVWLSLPESLERYVVLKGSIAVSGVSLTVSGLEPGRFRVSLIPTTLAATTLGRLEVGASVNLEVDVLAKYAERLLTGVTR